MKALLTRAMVASDKIGLADPDVAWLPPAWCYKALWLIHLL